ncbi:hypothetical protein HUJ04_004273 [Dendroctonus ponderosae]|nr:hypothetical protein HUJ04_004273 [Dendroctonus ponderosae]KAH1014471.1 hypothetical protein HUJ05_012332 [Dendroctonus ponderosae]KAH1014493.1 hypothetical protein HUJ05_012349 [Dendroctonus ponderosae]
MVTIKIANIIRIILLLLTIWALFTEANDYDPWWANEEYPHQIRAKPAAGRNGRKKFGGKGFITTAVAVGPGKK